MRIAFFIDVFPRISNTFIINQITGLIERGHEIDIFARGVGDFDNTHEDVKRFRLRERMRHIPIPRNHARRAAAAAVMLAQPANWHYALLDALNLGRYGHGAASLAQLYTVASFLRQPPYDVVHCQFGKLGPLLLPLYRSGRLAAKLVTSFRGADLTSGLAKRPERYAQLFRHGDLFLPVSASFRERLIELGCPPGKIVVHHSGIRCERFPFRERRREAGEATRVLFVGRLTEKKGAIYALRAAAEVLASGRPLTLTLVGDGEERQRLEAEIERLGIGGQVELAGTLKQSEVIERLLAAHLLVAPSLTASSGDQEGIPNVVKEAMATGLPVIATDHSGIPELVDDGVSGYLVAEADANALAGALRRLVDHPELWPGMGRAGRAKVEAEFDSERLNDELVELYRSSGTR